MNWMQRYGNVFYLAAAVMLAAVLGLGMPNDGRVKAQITNPTGVTQKNPVTPGNLAIWAGTGQIQDGGAPSASNPWTTIKKNADQSVNNTTVLTNDNTLCFAVAANTAYSFKHTVFFATLAAADIDLSYSGPAAPTIIEWNTTLAFSVNTSGFGTRFPDNVGLDGNYILVFIGRLLNGANAGTLCGSFSQTVATVGNTTILRGSLMEYVTVP